MWMTIVAALEGPSLWLVLADLARCHRRRARLISALQLGHGCGRKGRGVSAGSAKAEDAETSVFLPIMGDA